MAIAQAGIAFRISDPIDDLADVMSSVFDEEAVEIASPVADQFDTRNHADVMVQSFGDVCFVCNDDLAEPLLRNPAEDASRLHTALRAPPLLFAFRHDDSASSYGYAVFERGARKRTRLQTSAAPGPTSVAESGPPMAFERRWLAALHFVESHDAPRAQPAKVYYLGDREVLVPERELTGRMLQEGLEAHFDVCPWETLITPTYRFFRLESAAAAPRDGDGVAPATAAPKRAWWRFR